MMRTNRLFKGNLLSCCCRNRFGRLFCRCATAQNQANGKEYRENSFHNCHLFKKWWILLFIIFDFEFCVNPEPKACVYGKVLPHILGSLLYLSPTDTATLLLTMLIGLTPKETATRWVAVSLGRIAPFLISIVLWLALDRFFVTNNTDYGRNQGYRFTDCTAKGTFQYIVNQNKRAGNQYALAQVLRIAHAHTDGVDDQSKNNKQRMITIPGK